MSVQLSKGAESYLAWLERRQKQGKKGKLLKLKCMTCGGTWKEYVVGKDYPPCPGGCPSRDVIAIKERFMTREEILKQFEIDNYGIIRTPGKFEGHMLYVPYFWNMVLEGYGYEVYDEYNVPITFLEITKEDKKKFPEIRGVYGIALWEDDYGFVNTEEFKTKREYQKAIREIGLIEPEEY
jgi:hypothetical protein